jgi:hypothetical protein
MRLISRVRWQMATLLPRISDLRVRSSRKRDYYTRSNGRVRARACLTSHVPIDAPACHRPVARACDGMEHRLHSRRWNEGTGSESSGTSWRRQTGPLPASAAPSTVGRNQTETNLGEGKRGVFGSPTPEPVPSSRPLQAPEGANPSSSPPSPPTLTLPCFVEVGGERLHFGNVGSKVSGREGG